MSKNMYERIKKTKKKTKNRRFVKTAYISLAIFNFLNGCVSFNYSNITKLWQHIIQRDITQYPECRFDLHNVSQILPSPHGMKLGNVMTCQNVSM